MQICLPSSRSSMVSVMHRLSTPSRLSGSEPSPLNLLLAGVEVLLLDRDDLTGVLAVGVPLQWFLVQFEERVAPRELRENPLGVLPVAEDDERARERLHGVELERLPVVHGVGGDEER